jgi:hypothetical protein
LFQSAKIFNNFGSSHFEQGAFMKHVLSVILLLSLASLVCAQSAKTLFIYDEDNPQLEPFRLLLQNELSAQGVSYDSSSVADLNAVQLDTYENLILYSAVMAFGMKSPIRDWLKKNPQLQEKKIALIMTANRWSLDKLFKEIRALLTKQKVNVVDAVSGATKDLDADEKAKLVRDYVASLKIKLEI